MDNETNAAAPLDFIRAIVVNDVKNNKNNGAVVTRFPPEPNGYLHIGHAKAICLDFGIAAEFNGITHLRMDDTNPTKEDLEYVESIKQDVKWLGYDWGDKLFFASDYYEKLYERAVELIKRGKAYVCDLSPDEVREYRGTLTEPGRESPCRNRSVEENLDLFARMRNGEFEDGAKTLRAKIDMASPNMHMRDPAIYRIRREHHYRTGDKWCIYPMYDFAHCISDSIEGITHSICTLEFEIHRPLYDWFLDELEMPCHPQQIEFARLNLTYTVMSKRKLLTLVKEHYVNGWDDPRMPTLQGIRRRGYTPAALRLMVDRVGISKQNSLLDIGILEGALREDLDAAAPRRMAVIDPVKLVLANLPDDHEETLTFSNHPKDASFGQRSVPFSRELWIEREDFEEVPPKGFKRLTSGGEVRLRGAGIVRCDEVIKNDAGDIVELRGWLDPESRPGMAGAERKIKGTIHWVSAIHAVAAEIRLYDRLFTVPNPDDESEGKTYRDYMNPDSRRTVTGYVEPAAASAAPEQSFQFERTGYFVADRYDHTPERPVFNRSVTLRDTWATKA